MDYEKLAELLFPETDKLPSHYETMYPERNLPEGAMVTRLGPSPTGFIHLGNLYGAFIDERMAVLSKGIVYLRIEDTDDKRYVKGAEKMLLDSLSYFDIKFDEGITPEGEEGAYGPYHQSRRKEIYSCYVKELVKKGFAYPCFLTEEEISIIREEQTRLKLVPGIYGEYAKSEKLTFKEVEERIALNLPYVVRLKAQGSPFNLKILRVKDGIRGELAMPENFLHIVLLKQNGMPTYHLAHVVDDHLMRTTHVVRGAEWLSSLPVHLELFSKFGFEPPQYCHTPQLMKLSDNNTKRKLSKRLDPELSLLYYRQEGFHKDCVREYLMTLLNSDYEQWRKENPNKPLSDFPFSIEKMKSADALIDLNKLCDISKDVLLGKDVNEIYEFFKDWAFEFNRDIKGWFKDESFMKAILNIGREGEKPRKDLIYAKQIADHISYFFEDGLREQEDVPENIKDDDILVLLSEYLKTYNHSDDRSEWFNKIREISEKNGYAGKPKDFKNEPEKYKGHVGDVSTLIRLSLTGRRESPDLWEIQQILGEEKTKGRIRNYMTGREQNA